MRKILIGGLGVAGLLATVLALASSPATSQMVIAFATDTEPGKYTVNWSTRGGCDPSRPNADTTLATDGATGAISRTVSAPSVAGTVGVATADVLPDDATEDNPTNQGTSVEFSVAVAGHCSYDWTGSFVSNLPGSDGIRCAVEANTALDAAQTAAANARDGVLDGVAETAAAIVDTLRLGVSDTTCNEVAKVKVDVPRPSTSTDDDDIVPTQPHSGAILNTTFTIGAQQHTANNAPTNDECATVSGETEVSDPADTPSDTDDDIVSGEITVVQTPLSDGTHTCVYNAGVIVPAGFKATSRNSEGGRVASYGLGDKVIADRGDINGDGDQDDAAIGEDTGDEADTVPATLADCGDTVVRTDTDEDLATTDDQTTGIVGGKGSRCIEANVEVAERMIYILQNVVGDSGDANAKYSLTLDKECAIPHDLPENLLAREVGGIQTTKSVTVVELREGFFNISAAVMGRDTTDVDDYGRTFAPRFALNKDGEACSFTAEVEDLPDNCDAAEDSISANAVTGADSNGRVIVTFDIGCSDDAGDDAADDEAAADDGAADDMGDMDDDAADDDADMGDMGDDDADAMGPPADEPTG